MVLIIKVNRLLTTRERGVDSNHIISHLEMRENRPENGPQDPRLGPGFRSLPTRFLRGRGTLQLRGGFHKPHF